VRDQVSHPYSVDRFQFVFFMLFICDM
jgi:hypothetical protein